MIHYLSQNRVMSLMQILLKVTILSLKLCMRVFKELRIFTMVVTRGKDLPPYIPRKTVIHPVIVMKRTVMMAVKPETNCETCTGSISRINFQLKNGIETLPVNLSMQIYLFVKGERNIFLSRWH